MRAPPYGPDPAAGAGRREAGLRLRCPKVSLCRSVKWGDVPERPRTAHPRPSTACRHRSLLRAPLVLLWLSSSVPEGSPSAGAGRPWHRRARGWQPELDFSAAHRPRRARAASAWRERLRRALGLVSAPWLVSVPWLVSAPCPRHRPMGGQGGQRRWGLPRLPRRIALWPAAAAAGETLKEGAGRGAVVQCAD